MISPISSPFTTPTPALARPPGSDFGSMLDVAKAGLDRVSTMQHQATAAAESLALGETDDMAGALATVEKGELAFKALLAVRTKLMSALDEVRNMPV